MNTGAVQTGTRYPSRSEVASAHGRATNCWACGSADAVGIAASADWGGGFATDPREYGILCDNCYLKAPQLGTAEMFWAWLSRDRSAAGPARSTMKSMVDELASLPAEEREAVLIHGVALGLFVASRETEDHPAYRGDCAERTFGEVMEGALALVVDWLRDGSLSHRMDHPQEVLSQAELRQYAVRYARYLAK